MQDVVEHRRLLTVEASQSAQSEGVAHPQDVVAEASLLLFVVGIELCASEFQTLMIFAIDVDGLPVVEIDAVGHQLVLECCSVVVQLVVWVHTSVDGKARDVDVVLVFLFHLFI